MPHYDYKCKCCDNTFTVQQGINEEPLKRCPLACDGNGEVERVIAAPVPIFKGSGFYETDYKQAQKQGD